MKVALYARVSTKDKDQDPELQLVPMREHCARLGWESIEFVDHASAGDLAGRKEWRLLLGQITKVGGIDLVLVWKLDRAFRSTVHCLTTLEEFEKRGVSFATLTQSIDTSTAAGRLTLQILAAVAEFERSLIRERVTEGLRNARRKGSRLGRPPVTDRPGFSELWSSVSTELRDGRLSKRAAAGRLGVGVATVDRLLARAPKRRGRPETRGEAAAPDSPAA